MLSEGNSAELLVPGRHRLLCQPKMEGAFPYRAIIAMSSSSLSERATSRPAVGVHCGLIPVGGMLCVASLPVVTPFAAFPSPYKRTEPLTNPPAPCRATSMGLRWNLGALRSALRPDVIVNAAITTPTLSPRQALARDSHVEGQEMRFGGLVSACNVIDVHPRPLVPPLLAIWSATS